MARTAIPIQVIPRNGALANVAFTAADATNQHEFPNGGRVLLIAKNTDTANKTVTVVSVPDEAGRSGDLQITVSANGGVAIAGPFRPAWWNQRADADLGKVFVNVSAATNLGLAAVQLEE